MACYTDSLSQEILEQVLLHLDCRQKDNRVGIFSALTVSKSWYAAANGPALFERIAIWHHSQIRPLALCLAADPIKAQLIRWLDFSMAESKDHKSVVRHSFGAVVFILSMSRNLTRLIDVPILDVDYEDIVRSLKQLKKIKHFSAREYSDPHTRNLSINQTRKLCRYFPRLFMLVFDGYIMSWGPLSDWEPLALTYLALYECSISGSCFSIILREYRDYLNHIELYKCTELAINDFVKAVVGITPYIQHLELVDTFSAGKKPTKYDYLNQLKTLKTATFCKGSLADDGLIYPPLSVKEVILHAAAVSLADLAAAIGVARNLNFVLKGWQLNDRERSMLKIVASRNRDSATVCYDD